jgi:hypothetical protein
MKSHYESLILAAMIVIASVFALRNLTQITISDLAFAQSHSQNEALYVTPKWSGGPLDGHYKIVEFSCGSNDILAMTQATGAMPVSFDIAGGAAAEVVRLPGACIASTEFHFEYQPSAELTAQIGETNCSTLCSSSQCVPLPSYETAQRLRYHFAVFDRNVVLNHILTFDEINDPSLIFGYAHCASGDRISMALVPETKLQRPILPSNQLAGVYNGPCVVDVNGVSSHQAKLAIDGNHHLSYSVAASDSSTCSPSVAGALSAASISEKARFEFRYVDLGESSFNKGAELIHLSAAAPAGVPVAVDPSIQLPRFISEALQGNGFFQIQIVDGALYFSDDAKSQLDRSLAFHHVDSL